MTVENPSPAAPMQPLVQTCLLGLLFLLIKEERPTGWVQVTVQGPGLSHPTQVPVSCQEMVTDLYARVDYARSLAAAAQM